jgi:hypothetical protein
MIKFDQVINAKEGTCMHFEKKKSKSLNLLLYLCQLFISIIFLLIWLNNSYVL